MNPPPENRGRFGGWLFGLVEGALVVAMVANVRDAVREDWTFRDIAAQATAGTTTPEERVLAILHKTSTVLDPLREGLHEGRIADITALTHYRRVLFDSVGSSMIFPNGECGSFAGVCAKLLRAEGFHVRFGQMLERDDVTSTSIHIVVEVWLDGRWIVCDPYYDLVLRAADGRLLGFEDIHRDWDQIKAQCPPGYDERYDYRGIRRVNFKWLNRWLQQTPLAEFSIRVWLNEGAWIRSGLVTLGLAAVVGMHVWYLRLLRSEGRPAAADAARAPRTAPQRIEREPAAFS